MLHRKIAGLFVALLASVALGGTAQAVPLQDLIDGDTLTVDGLLFSDFTYSATGDMPDAEDIEVTTIPGGIRFQGAFADAPGGPFSDALIGYTVSVVDGPDIIDAHLVGNPNVAGEGFAIATVDELLIGTDCSGQPCRLEIFDVVGGGEQVTDDVDFGPVTEIVVVKDIMLISPPAGTAGQGVAQISVIDQTFTRDEVPEPAALGLGAIALAALRGARRRR